MAAAFASRTQVTHSITATEGTDSNYKTPTSGTGTLTVTKTSQTITFNGLPSSVTFSAGLAYTLNGTASSGLPVSYTVSGPATLSGSTLTINGVGTVSVRATVKKSLGGPGDGGALQDSGDARQSGRPDRFRGQGTRAGPAGTAHHGCAHSGAPGHHLCQGTRLTAKLDSKDEEGREVTFDARKMRHFDHGYAVNSHSSQGVTADRMLVNMDTRAHPELINTRFA